MVSGFAGLPGHGGAGLHEWISSQDCPRRLVRPGRRGNRRAGPIRFCLEAGGSPFVKPPHGRRSTAPPVSTPDRRHADRLGRRSSLTLRRRPTSPRGSQAGDRLIVVMQDSGALLHVPGAVHELVRRRRRPERRERLRRPGRRSRTNSITRLLRPSSRLGSRRRGRPGRKIVAANAEDVARRRRPRPQRRPGCASPTHGCGADMIAGLADLGATRRAAGRERVLERVDHDGWSVELVDRAARCRRLRVRGPPERVRRRGRLCCAAAIRWCSASAATPSRTARAPWPNEALAPALAGDPACRPAFRGAGRQRRTRGRLGPVRRSAGCRSPSRAGRGRPSRSWARIARQSGTPVSLHGTGGAWLIADVERRRRPVRRRRRGTRSIARCATRSTSAASLRARAEDLSLPPSWPPSWPPATARGHGVKLHVAAGDEARLPLELARGAHPRPPRRRRLIDESHGCRSSPRPILAREWEWEDDARGQS